MALFFDQKWFNKQLESAGLSKGDLARALGLSETEFAEMWKDQREISDRELSTMALLLGASEDEVQKRGGVQGSPAVRAALKARLSPAEPAAGTHPAEQGIEARLGRIEVLLEEILKKLKRSA